jgi:hypothetical protein
VGRPSDQPCGRGDSASASTHHGSGFILRGDARDARGFLASAAFRYTDCPEEEMRLSISTLLKVDAVVTVVAFCVSGVLRHAKHGIGYVAGDIAWFTFLAGFLALLILGAVSAIIAIRQRQARSAS